MLRVIKGVLKFVRYVTTSLFIFFVQMSFVAAFVVYSAMAIRWVEDRFINPVAHLFNPYFILKFFDILLFPVLPLIVLGIFIGHKRFTRPDIYYRSFFAWLSIFLSCFVPIFFMLMCVISSFYMLFFFKSGLKHALRWKLITAVLFIRKEDIFEKFLLRLRDWSVSVGTVKIFPFSDDSVVEHLVDCLENTKISEIYDNAFTDYLVQIVVQIVESEFLDSSSPYSIYLPDLTVEWKFLFDELTVSMFLVVSVITFLVILFAWVYMAHDERRPIFFFLLTIFAGFMIILVASYNYLMLFIGWEGVGLSSFLLINFWYTRTQANKAAAKAVIVNRVGDIFLITALGLIYYTTNTFDFGLVADRMYFVGSSSLIELVCLFLFLAAVGKSAQLGLHTWLPDAIEGPTPVSALLHAATMVTAGVYLLLRSSALISYSSVVPVVMSVVGLLTAFFAATVALIQYDMKKVIAYSTCSQLGYMIMGVGLKQFNVAFFHLFNHAFFKALLFIAAGSVIHVLLNEQDMRRMGGLANSSFYLFLSNSIGVAALAGSIFLSGFYSKDLILETSVTIFTVDGLTIYWLATLTAIFTGIYSSDLLDDVFVEETNARKYVIENMHPISVIESFVLLILVIFSLFSGYLCKDMFVGLGSPFLTSQYSTGGELYISNNFTGVCSTLNTIVSAEFLPVSIKVLPVVLSLVVGFQCYQAEGTVYRLYKVVSFMSYKWYFDILQNRYLVYNFFKLGYSVFWMWDKYLFEQFRLPKFLNRV